MGMSGNAATSMMTPSRQSLRKPVWMMYLRPNSCSVMYLNGTMVLPGMLRLAVLCGFNEPYDLRRFRSTRLRTAIQERAMRLLRSMVLTVTVQSTAAGKPCKIIQTLVAEPEIDSRELGTRNIRDATIIAT
jgi:hypothetical protein